MQTNNTETQYSTVFERLELYYAYCSTLSANSFQQNRSGWYKNNNSTALVRERIIPTESPPFVGEVSANFCG
jgi:hypothetical protein